MLGLVVLLVVVLSGFCYYRVIAPTPGRPGIPPQTEPDGGR